MSISTFSLKLSEDYPVRLVSEFLVILTFAGAGWLLHRMLRPLGEKYIGWYRNRSIRRINRSLERTSYLLENNHFRTQKMIFEGFLFMGHMIGVFGLGAWAFLMVLTSSPENSSLFTAQALILLSSLNGFWAALSLVRLFLAFYAEQYKERLERRLFKLQRILQT